MSPHLDKPNETVQPTELAISATTTDSTQLTQAWHHSESILGNPILHAVHESLSPLSYLAPELLGAIFLECVSQWYREIVSTKYLAAPRWAWVTILRVCRYWRDVAVNYSALWSFLCIGPESQMDILLGRSKSRPLYIYFDYWTLSRPATAAAYGALSTALEHIDRVEELTLTLDDETPEDILKRLASPAPLLGSFQIRGLSGFPHVHTTIFERDVPRLARLHLVSCQVDWSSPVFSENLTHLTLDNINPFGDKDQFFLLLGKMHKLQKLSWNNLSYVRDMQSTGQIKLLFLQELNFTDNLHTITMFFSRFKIPLSTVVELEFYADESNLGWNSIHSFIKTRFGSMSEMSQDHLPLRSLVLHHSNEPLQEVYCTTEAKAQAVDDSPGVLYIRFRSGTSSNFYSILPASDLEELTISFNGCVPDMNPWTTFNAPQLRVIHLRTNGLGILLRALQSFHSGVIFAPALTELRLHSIKFAPRCECSQCSRVVDGVKCLQDGLARRAELHHKVQTLVMHSWYDGDKPKIRRFKCVNKVEFRGIKMQRFDPECHASLNYWGIFDNDDV